VLLALLFAFAPAAHAVAPEAAPAAPPAADCGQPVFTFVGQPECVSLVFDGGHTQLDNGCDVPLLIDVSVLAGVGGGPSIPAGGTAELRDLSAFSLGVDGEIHRATAMVEIPECAAPEPELEPEPEPEPAPVESGSLLQSVLAFVRLG
jgi:hypothetical protein